ncbi:hypothetical protein MUU72_29910 [Streptomyces sp. RS10V-4]|uniref:hypothetical protein n=1 Tax=Streptomyces rhizoryzae TaxID=2932493 RepID=UPI002003E3B5|nr:hypothetical protein [Streptomyces rhizoryzae]MCK7627262.1 hypothetical protein [Streptomyces rhizoryzae]
MTGLLAALVLLLWLFGTVFLAGFFSSLLANEPMLRLAAQLRPAAVALYLAVAAVFLPAFVAVRAVEALVKRERP